MSEQRKYPPRRRGASPSASATARVADPRRRFFDAILGRQQMLPVLVVAMLALTALMGAAAYFAARASALDAAETRAAQNAAIGQEIVLEQGQFVSPSSDGGLAVNGGDTDYTLTGDTAVVDHIKAVTGHDALIYKLNGTAFVSIAATLLAPGVDSHMAVPPRLIGAQLTGAVTDALLADCATNSTTTCASHYTGTALLNGRSMEVGVAPLFDQNGTLVGALAVAEPMDDILRAPLQFVVVLAMVGLLCTLIALVAGTFFLSRTRPTRALAKLDDRLATAVVAASELREASRLQVARAQRQDRAARLVSELARDVDQIAGTIERDEADLRRSVTNIWAEMSQPGVPNPSVALQMARASAVASARIGMSGQEMRARAHSLLSLMNQMLAEDKLMANEGRETERYTEQLRAALADVEATLDDRPPASRGGSVSRSSAPWPGIPPVQSPSQQQPRRSAGPQNSHFATPSSGPQSGMHPFYTTGQIRAIRFPPPNNPNAPKPPNPPSKYDMPRPPRLQPPTPRLPQGPQGPQGSQGPQPGTPWNVSGDIWQGWQPYDPNNPGGSQPHRPNNESGWLND